MEGARPAFPIAREPHHGRALVAAQADADIAVEQALPVAVFGDEQQAAMELRSALAAVRSQRFLDARVEAARALRAFAHGGQQT